MTKVDRTIGARNTLSVLSAMLVAVAMSLLVGMMGQPQLAWASTSETEPNDTLEYANGIAVGKTIVGYYGEDDTVDFYKIRVPQSGKLEVALHNMEYYRDDNGGCNITLSVGDKCKADDDTYVFDSSKDLTVASVDTARAVATLKLTQGIHYVCVTTSGSTPEAAHEYRFILNYKVDNTQIVKLTPAKKKFTAKWAKKSGALKYQIRYSLKKNMTKAKTVTVSKNKVSKTIKAKGKKRYYVQIRVAKSIGGKTYYSDWSAPKSVKTKR